MDHSVLEIIRYNLPSDKIESFESAYAKAAAYLENSLHCLGYNVIHSIEQPNLFIIIIRWDSVEGHTEGFSNSADLEKFLSYLKPYLDHIVEMNHYKETSVQWKQTNTDIP